jgi:dTDP-4-amino-4,6-dideoxygalactose transaminase
MNREIGSEFWIDKIDLKGTDSGVLRWLKKFGNIVFTSSGRGAIKLILDQIAIKIKRVLLPSYICESVIMSFEEAGYELIYYDVDEHFIPINIEIGSIEIGIFFHMGYFGFPTNESLSDIITKLRVKSVIIIEDITHTLFSNYQRLIDNDFMIGSIRKWFGLPSGGFLVSNKIINKELSDPPSDFIDLRVNSLQQKFMYLKTMNKSLKDDYLAGFKKAEQMLDEDTGVYKIDSMSEMIIKNIDIEDINNYRRTNYEFLLKYLSNINGIEIIFETVENNICPMFFPIYVKHDRDELRSDLIKKEIYCPIHWPISNQLNGQLNYKTKNIYNSVLSIPCDQRYGVEDMLRIINTIKELI